MEKISTDNELISVIIPVYNDEERLKKCIYALENQSCDRNYEIIVVDNGSMNKPRFDKKTFPRTKIYIESKIGSYAARNKGIFMAKGSLFAFTDSDCIPDRNWLQTAIKIMTKSPDIMLIAGKIILFPKLMQAPTSVELFDAAFALNQEYAVRKKRAYTANLIIRKKVFDDIGLFFSETISGGDVEFTNRATARGYKLIYAPEMIVKHPARRTYGEYRRKIRRVVEGGYKLKDENPDFCRTFTVPSIIKGFITPFRSSFYLLGGKRCKKLGIFAKSRIIVVLFHNKYYMQYVRIKYRLGFVSVHKRL